MIAALLVGLAGLAGCITLLFLGMRAVMDVGGFCAEGGPYEIATHCPEGTVVLMPLSIFGGLASYALAQVGGSAVGGVYAALPALAWPGLFLSLGWNFLEYGFNPPGEVGWAWGWLICGVIFWAMGGIPLGIGVWGYQATRGIVPGRLRRPSLGREDGQDPAALRRPRQASQSSWHPVEAESLTIAGTHARAMGRPSGEPVAHGAGGAAGRGGNLVDDLERLARLHDTGALDDAEFEAAKARLLGDGTPT
jgi:hypothetical protein